MQVFNRLTILTVASAIALSLASGAAYAKGKPKACKGLPTHGELLEALNASGATVVDDPATPANEDLNGGFHLNMWGTVVNRDGIVCAVAFTGADRDEQWPGSRVISEAKAYTANAYSLPGLALSTANLYASGQPGGSLWGLQFSNPVATDHPKGAYKGPAKNFGQANDPMVGSRIGGQIVFGGGFALYNDAGEIVGGLGVSGDTSCKDHNFGWRVRNALGLDHVPAGVSGDATRPDNIIYDMGAASQGLIVSPSGFGHTDCGLGEAAISATLPTIP